jgi:hypothetical protein
MEPADCPREGAGLVPAGEFLTGGFWILTVIDIPPH